MQNHIGSLKCDNKTEMQMGKSYFKGGMKRAVAHKRLKELWHLEIRQFSNSIVLLTTNATPMLHHARLLLLYPQFCILLCCGVCRLAEYSLLNFLILRRLAYFTFQFSAGWVIDNEVNPRWGPEQMKGRWQSNINVLFPFMYYHKWNCYFQNRMIMFSLQDPTLLYLWEIYIFPGSICLFCCREICGQILGTYKSLTDTWM